MTQEIKYNPCFSGENPKYCQKPQQPKENNANHYCYLILCPNVNLGFESSLFLALPGAATYCSQPDGGWTTPPHPPNIKMKRERETDACLCAPEATDSVRLPACWYSTLFCVMPAVASRWATHRDTGPLTYWKLRARGSAEWITTWAELSAFLFHGLTDLLMSHTKGH